MSESNKTKAYGNNLGKTQAYHDGKRKTQAYGEPGKTKGYDPQESSKVDRTETHGLGINDEIELNSKKYIITDIISGDNVTGEAVIYKIKDVQGNVYSLKLYYKLIDPGNEPNPEALERIKEINDSDILKLYDFGTGINKYLNKFCFEICDFAKGSDLIAVPGIKKKYTLAFLKSNVIPEIFKGIRTLHDYKIYHCDLKPENIFFLNENQTDLVIGDYGSAKTFEKATDQRAHLTKTAKFTKGYDAPELSTGIISEKNDYHSFGMVLLYLLYSELFHDNFFDKIRERQFARLPIIEFNPGFGRINDLIAGLTLFDATSRWGSNEVKSWINNDKVEVKYTGETEAGIKPIKLGTFTVHDVDDLIDYVQNNSQWYDYLIEDSDGYRLLLQFVYDILDLEKKKIFDKMVRTYQQDGEAFLKQCILRYFKPPKPIYVDMKSYDFGNSQNIVDLAVSFFIHLNDISKVISLEKLKFYVFQFEFVLRQIGLNADEQQKSLVESIIKNISSVFSLPPDLKFENCICGFYVKIETFLDIFSILYALNPSLPLKFENEVEITHPAQLEDIISTNPALINNLKDFIYDGKFEVWLRYAFPDRNQDQTFVFKCRNTYKRDKDLGVYAVRWHFKPSLPFPFGNKQAKNPKALAALIDNSRADKNLCIKLLSDGWIRTWLVTTGYLKDTSKFDEVIKTAGKEWDQSIEAVLHILDPKLPWPEVTSSYESINLGRVNIESSKIIDITFKNSQRGFLAGTISLEGTGKGVTIDKRLIKGEPLALSLKVIPKGLPVGSTQKANLSIYTNGNNLEIPVFYKVTAPVMQMIGRSIGIGFFCAFIFGVFRMIIPYRFLVWQDWGQIENTYNQPIIILLMILFIGIIGGGLFYFNTLSKIQEQNYKKT